MVPLDQLRLLEWSAIRDLLFAIEVLSPSSARADRFTKHRLYQAQKVPLYWVVDADSEAVEVWKPEQLAPVVELERIEWSPAGAGRPFTLRLDRLFRQV